MTSRFDPSTSGLNCVYQTSLSTSSSVSTKLDHRRPLANMGLFPLSPMFCRPFLGTAHRAARTPPLNGRYFVPSAAQTAARYQHSYTSAEFAQKIRIMLHMKQGARQDWYKFIVKIGFTGLGLGITFLAAPVLYCDRMCPVDLGFTLSTEPVLFDSCNVQACASNHHHRSPSPSGQGRACSAVNTSSTSPNFQPQLL